MSTRSKIPAQDRLIRCWVGIVDENGDDLVARQSIILHIGENTIRVHWRFKQSELPLPDVAKSAALYVRRDDPRPKHTKPVVSGSTVSLVGERSLFLNWWIKLHKPEL